MISHSFVVDAGEQRVEQVHAALGALGGAVLFERAAERPGLVTVGEPAGEGDAREDAGRVRVFGAQPLEVGIAAGRGVVVGQELVELLAEVGVIGSGREVHIHEENQGMRAGVQRVRRVAEAVAT